MKLSTYKFLYYKVRPAELAAVLKRILRIKRKVIQHKDYFVDIDPVSYHGLTLLSGGEYEADMTEQLESILQKGDVFVDVGANEGYFSIVASKRVGSSGKVIVVEPQKRCMDVIISNIEINGLNNCVLLPFAVGDSKGTAEITLYPTLNTGASTLSDSFNFKQKFGFLRKIFQKKQTVRVKTLDELVSDFGDIKLFKIDIEGFEMKALKGMSAILSSGKVKNLLIEIHPVAMESLGDSESELRRFVTSFKYHEKRINNELYLFTL